MNVGIVTTWFERGAAYVSRQYRQVLASQHEVFIYARGGEAYATGDPVWDDPRVTWAESGVVPTPMSMDLDDFGRWLKRNQIEVVLFNEQHWWEPVLLCNKLGLKTGAYVDYYTEETVPLFGLYDFLICNTRRHFSVFQWHPQAIPIPWGTDTTLFRPSRSAPVTPGYLTFFHSGGVSPPRKGTDLVLRAFSVLRGPAKLVVHVQVDLGECFPDLRDLIRELQQRGSLSCHIGTVAAPGLYHLGDVYVYPSRLEGIGLTIAEALACGLPVIVPDNPPMSEFVDDSNGRLVKVSRFEKRADGYYWPQCLADVADLTAAMEGYVDGLDRFVELRTQARDYAERHLDWTKNARSLPGMLPSLERLPEAEKAKTTRLARAFERRRSLQSVRFWLSYNCPNFVKMARCWWRRLKRHVGSRGR